MSSGIAKYYADELAEWKRTITSYLPEMNEFEVKLEEVVQRNTIPDIGARVEQHQQKLNLASGKFYALETLIQHQEQAVKTKEAFIEDKLISTEIENEQARIRHEMREAEKEYVDTKYGCYSFFAETIIKQASS